MPEKKTSKVAGGNDFHRNIVNTATVKILGISACTFLSVGFQ